MRVLVLAVLACVVAFGQGVQMPSNIKGKDIPAWINQNVPTKDAAGNVTIGTAVLARCAGTDDSAMLTAALAAATEVRVSGVCVAPSVLTIPKGKKLVLGPGTHTVGGIRFSDSTTDQTGTGALECAGSGVSTIKLKDGADVDLISQANFAALTGQNSAYGLFGASIQGCTLDGNKANQTAASYGVRLYGHALKFRDVFVVNAYTDGIYTEWGKDSTFAAPSMDLEGQFSDIKSAFNGGNGWTFRGPHDSQIVNATLYQNGGWGFRNETGAAYNGAGSWISNMNTFLNTSGGIYSNNSLNGSQVVATTATGHGMLIDTGAGLHDISSALFSGPIGLEVKAPNQHISGTISNTTTAALKIDGGSGAFFIQSYNNTGHQIDFAAVDGQSTIFFSSQLAVPGTMFGGTPPQGSYISMAFGGSSANQYIQIPSRTLKAAGWSPMLPQSDGTMSAVVGVPGAKTAYCGANEIAVNATHFYWCCDPNGTDKWCRVAKDGTW